MSARVVEVIVDDNGRRGTGKVDDPMRTIVSIHTTDGYLVAQIDPHFGVLLGGRPDRLLEGCPE